MSRSYSVCRSAFRSLEVVLVYILRGLNCTLYRNSVALCKRRINSPYCSAVVLVLSGCIPMKLYGLDWPQLVCSPEQ